MASDSDLAAWRKRMAAGEFLHMNSAQLGAAINEAFPTPEAKRFFYDWNAHRQMAKLQLPQNVPPVSRDDYVAKVDSMDYLSGKDEGILVEWMQRPVRPWIPLGRDAVGTAYRLAPEAYGLRAQRLDHEEDETGIPFLNDSYLGINTTVQPREPAQPANRRKANLSEMSTKSAESDDETPGFEFFQLGALEYHPGQLPSDMEEAGRAMWLRTGYFVVARFGYTGSIQGLYVVFDMFPEDVDGERVQITGTNWGRLPSGHEQFTCAKIGNRLKDMGFKRQLQWSDKTEHPVELVPLVRKPDGRAMRWMIDGAAAKT